VIIVGLPIAIYQMDAARLEAHNHALESHEQVYSGLDAQYTDFLKLCLQNPKLDCFDLPNNPPPPLGESERSQQRILYAILIPMLEHAFLAYHGKPAAEIKALTDAQWPGWKRYASNFMIRPAFLSVWTSLKYEFDKHFSACMDSLDPSAPPMDLDADDNPCYQWSSLNSW
jgi:hypothetical protein